MRTTSTSESSPVKFPKMKDGLRTAADKALEKAKGARREFREVVTSKAPPQQPKRSIMNDINNVNMWTKKINEKIDEDVGPARKRPKKADAVADAAQENLKLKVKQDFGKMKASTTSKKKKAIAQIKGQSKMTAFLRM